MILSTKMLLVFCSLLFILLMTTFFQIIFHQEDGFIPLNSEHELQRFLEGQNFRGVWSSSNSELSSTLLDHLEGAAQASFSRYLNISSYNIGLFKSPVSIVTFWVHDPYFRDDKMLKITNFVSYQIVDGLFQNPPSRNSSFSIISYEDTQYSQQFHCKHSSVIEIDPNVLTPSGFDVKAFRFSENVLRVHLTAETPCNLNLSFSLKVLPIKNNIKSLFYSTFLILIVMLNWHGALRLANCMLEDLNYVKRLSLVTSVMACCQDSFVLIFNLTFGINFSSDLNYFLIFLLFFVQFTFIDFRVTMSIWRFQNSRELSELSQSQARKKAYCFQVLFYGVVLSFNYFMWKYFLHPYFIVLNSLILFPQIYHNCNQPIVVSFDTNFLIFFSAIKYLIFFYFRGCPVNIILLKYNYLFSFFGLFLLLASIVIIFLQSRLGANFFIPRTFLHTFDYFIEKSQYIKNQRQQDIKENETNQEICPICFVNLIDNQNEEGHRIEATTNIFDRILKKRRNTLMITPCQHIFHSPCLLRWAETKMECPTCRAVLPQIY